MYALATKIHFREETTFWSLVAIIFMLSLMYGYFVNVTIFNVADRIKLESKITQLDSKLGEMEFEYLSLKSSVTIEKAYELGFINSQSTHFVSRDSSTKGLSFNNR